MERSAILTMQNKKYLPNNSLTSFNYEMLNTILNKLEQLKENYQTKINELEKQNNHSCLRDQIETYKYLVYIIDMLNEEAYSIGKFDFTDYKLFLSRLCDISEKIEYELF